MQRFGTKRQKFRHCPGTKERRDKLKILPWDRTGQPVKIQDGTWDGTKNKKYGFMVANDDLEDKTTPFTGFYTHAISGPNIP